MLSIFNQVRDFETCLISLKPLKKKKKGAMTAAKLFVMCLQFMYTIPCTQKKF